jgi:uncharacterized membrane protein YhaH (DUF805 family)
MITRVSWSLPDPPEAIRPSGNDQGLHVRGTLNVGRDPANDIVLSDRTVSRTHAQIRWHDRGVTILDCRSKNGTYLERQRINQAEWKPGQIVNIGPYALEMSHPDRLSNAAIEVATSHMPLVQNWEHSRWGVSWYFQVLGNVAFTGRARRREYWYFLLFHLMTVAVLVLLGVGGQMPSAAHSAQNQVGFQSYPVPALIYVLLTLVQSLAVTVRRLHDRNLSGWWILPLNVPLLGTIATVILFSLPGEKGSNRYGLDPKASQKSEA